MHKLRICLKELKETRRWLRLAKVVQLLEPKLTAILKKLKSSSEFSSRASGRPKKMRNDVRILLER